MEWQEAEDLKEVWIGEFSAGLNRSTKKGVVSCTVRYHSINGILAPKLGLPTKSLVGSLWRSGTPEISQENWI